MWFRGVVASMGLCLDLGAILEGHPDVVLAVNGDVVGQRGVAAAFGNDDVAIAAGVHVGVKIVVSKEGKVCEA